MRMAVDVSTLGSPPLGIPKDLAGGNDLRNPLARRCITAMKIGMVLFDRLAERPLEGLSVRARVDAQGSAFFAAPVARPSRPTGLRWLNFQRIAAAVLGEPAETRPGEV
jgi:hypothetical protein